MGVNVNKLLEGLEELTTEEKEFIKQTFVTKGAKMDQDLKQENDKNTTEPGERES